MFSRRRLIGNLISAYKYLMDGSHRNEARLFSVVPSNRTRGNGNELEHGKFHLNTYLVGDRALKQAVRRDCGVAFSGDTQT